MSKVIDKITLKCQQNVTIIVLNSLHQLHTYNKLIKLGQTISQLGYALNLSAKLQHRKNWQVGFW